MEGGDTLDASVIINAVTNLILALAAMGMVLFKVWRKTRQSKKKRPRK